MADIDLNRLPPVELAWSCARREASDASKEQRPPRKVQPAQLADESTEDEAEDRTAPGETTGFDSFA